MLCVCVSCSMTCLPPLSPLMVGSSRWSTPLRRWRTAGQFRPPSPSTPLISVCVSVCKLCVCLCNFQHSYRDPLQRWSRVWGGEAHFVQTLRGGVQQTHLQHWQTRWHGNSWFLFFLSPVSLSCDGLKRHAESVVFFFLLLLLFSHNLLAGRDRLLNCF